MALDISGFLKCTAARSGDSSQALKSNIRVPSHSSRKMSAIVSFVEYCDRYSLAFDAVLFATVARNGIRLQLLSRVIYSVTEDYPLAEVDRFARIGFVVKIYHESYRNRKTWTRGAAVKGLFKIYLARRWAKVIISHIILSMLRSVLRMEIRLYPSTGT